MIELSGYLGAFLLAICGLPQAVQSYKQGHSNGINIATVLMWFWGEIFIIIYVLPKGDIPLLLNYAANLAIISTIARYKFWPRRPLC